MTVSAFDGKVISTPMRYLPRLTQQIWKLNTNITNSPNSKICSGVRGAGSPPPVKRYPERSKFLETGGVNHWGTQFAGVSVNSVPRPWAVTLLAYFTQRVPQARGTATLQHRRTKKDLAGSLLVFEAHGHYRDHYTALLTTKLTFAASPDLAGHAAYVTYIFGRASAPLDPTDRIGCYCLSRFISHVLFIISCYIRDSL